MNGTKNLLQSQELQPPHDAEAEMAVLGAMFIEREAASAAFELLDAGSFYKTEHQRIFLSMRRLFERSEPIDTITLAAELKCSGELEAVGGSYYLIELAARVPSAANVEYHARLVQRESKKRRQISTLNLMLVNRRNGTDELEYDELLKQLNETKNAGLEDGFIVAEPPEKLGIEEIVPNFAYAGCVTTIAGASGNCKSLYTQWLTSRQKNPALYLVGFDHAASTFYLRQRSMTGNSVVPVELSPNSGLSPDFDSEKFWRALEKTVAKHQARVVIFDTVLDFLCGEYNRAGDLNRPLQRCREFAACTRTAIILVTHLSKAAGKKDELIIHDVADSRIVVTKSDMVLAFQFRKRNGGAWLLRISTLKNRMGEISNPTVFRLYTPKDTPEGIYDFVRTEEEFPRLQSEEELSALESAVKDLGEILANGARPASEVQAEMRALLHSEATIRRAREKVCKKPRKSPGGWAWELQDAQDAQDAQHDPLERLELLEHLATPACYACGGTDFWCSGDRWVCSRCHPNPTPSTPQKRRQRGF